MPAFDPVRDAVLNSPVAQSYPQPNRPTMHNDGRPSSSSSSSAYPNPAAAYPPAVAGSPISPSLGRRATDLSVLLNADTPEPPLFTPVEPTPTSRASISHILHNTNGPSPSPVADDRLASAEPFQRSHRFDQPREEHHSYFPNRRTSISSPSSSRAPLPPPPPPQAHQSPTMATRRAPSSPISHRPASRPSSSSSTPSSYTATTLTPRTTTSPAVPAPTTLPYAPTHRISPAGSVLVPMSPAELEQYRNYRGQGAQRLKRKRGASPGADATLPPAKRLEGDVGVVASHYNARPDVGVKQRRESPIIGLKHFNNWVKSVLITRFAHPALQGANASSGQGRERRGPSAPAGRVLDMGCGKGGDLTKWAKARVRDLVGVDIAAKSVAQARARWEDMRGARFNATFAALDCYADSLTTALPKDALAPPFDVVSMQFCMHYAFESVQKVRVMLENASRFLRKGGVFVGTIPNAEQLLERLDALPEDAAELSWGNAVYRIRFEERRHAGIFGHKYWFFLQDAVEDVPEWVVPWEPFVQVASEYDLHPVYKEEFHQVFAAHQQHPEFGPLMVRMNVVDARGESAMDEDQWEAANVYIAFAFEKR